MALSELAPHAKNDLVVSLAALLCEDSCEYRFVPSSMDGSSAMWLALETRVVLLLVASNQWLRTSGDPNPQLVFLRTLK